MCRVAVGLLYDYFKNFENMRGIMNKLFFLSLLMIIGELVAMDAPRGELKRTSSRLQELAVPAGDCFDEIDVVGDRDYIKGPCAKRPISFLDSARETPTERAGSTVTTELMTPVCDAQSKLVSAADEGTLTHENLKEFLGKGATIDGYDTVCIESPISAAAMAGRPASVDLLLKNGAIDWESALIAAAYSGHEDVVKVILDHIGVRIKHTQLSMAEKKYVDTAELFAQENKHDKIAQLIAQTIKFLDQVPR